MRKVWQDVALDNRHQDGDHDCGDSDVLEVPLAVVEESTWGFDPAVTEVLVGQRVRLT